VRYREPKADDDDDDGGGGGGGGRDDDKRRKRKRDTSSTLVLQRQQLDDVDDTLVHTNSSNNRRQFRRQIGNNGILTAVLLSDPQYPAQGPPGYPLQILMQASSPTGGGRSNVISVAPWNSGVFALSDSDHGFVQIWRLDGISDLPSDGPHRPIAPLNINSRPNPPLPNVRTNIVAEWHAPPAAVGDPRVLNDDRDDDNGNGPIQFGRGCCAYAAWLN
jgi:hypothetical protein